METISSRKNPLISHMRKLGVDRAYRREKGELICDGHKLLNDAINSRQKITSVVYCGEKPQLPEDILSVKVTEDIIESLTSFKNPQDIVFACKMPDLKTPLLPGKHIILENMQDPGNVGTIIRTANALKIDSIILAGECADPFNPKTVRASMGAIFRQKIIEMDIGDLITGLAAHEIPLYSSALSEEAEDIRTVSFPPELALAVGNEGKGLSRRLLEASSKKLMIPMEPDSESLNAAAAAAILIWELYKA